MIAIPAKKINTKVTSKSETLGAMDLFLISAITVTIKKTSQRKFSNVAIVEIVESAGNASKGQIGLNVTETSAKGNLAISQTTLLDSTPFALGQLIGSKTDLASTDNPSLFF